MQQSTREEQIRERAYQIWEMEGRPDGDHERHWQQATEELKAGETPAEASGLPATGGPADGIATSLQPGGTLPGGGPAAGRADAMGKGAKGRRGI